jgi:hypothetical protein
VHGGERALVGSQIACGCRQKPAGADTHLICLAKVLVAMDGTVGV